MAEVLQYSSHEDGFLILVDLLNGIGVGVDGGREGVGLSLVCGVCNWWLSEAHQSWCKSWRGVEYREISHWVNGMVWWCHLRVELYGVGWYFSG